MMCNALRELFKEELEEATAAATAATTEKVQSTMCRDIDQILGCYGMDAEKSVERIREYIAAKRAGKSGNEVIV